MKQIWRNKRINKMSSRIDIQKRCKWCNAVFTAHKTTTEYCSHRCANLAYKDRVRKQRIESLQHELRKSIKTPPNLNKEYLTPSEVAKLLNVGRTSIYRYIRNGVIKVIRFERKTLVRRADIEDMTDFIVQEAANKHAALIQQEGDETCLTRLMDAVTVTSEYKYFNIIEP